jgi:cytochrome c oxidase assembly protein subunit 15
MTEPRHHPWLTRYTVLTGVATLGLICLGGLVTSHGVGMAVPDWPTTYGYNMFFFPISQWVGGIFYEHTHRLVASGVGLMTLVLAVWIWVAERRRWMRWLGVIAALAVVLQGVLGGLRVIAMQAGLGVVHATLAQLFLVLVSALALFSSRWWMSRGSPSETICVPRWTVHLYGTVTGLIVLQLVLGALMRHQHAGLAIPDFPAAYGRLWPAMDAESISRYNQLRLEATDSNPITAGGVGLQMAHRVTAVLILLGVAGLAWSAMRHWGWRQRLTQVSVGWLGLIVCQVALGAATIWTHKSADITTAHVAVGSLSLVTGAMLLLVCCRHSRRLVPMASEGAKPGWDETTPGRALPA